MTCFRFAVKHSGRVAEWRVDAPGLLAQQFSLGSGATGRACAHTAGQPGLDRAAQPRGKVTKESGAVGGVQHGRSTQRMEEVSGMKAGGLGSTDGNQEGCAMKARAPRGTKIKFYEGEAG